MTETRKDWPFELSFDEGRLTSALVVLRAESAEELGQAYLDVQLALDGALGQPEEEAAAQATRVMQAPPPPPPAEAAAQMGAGDRYKIMAAKKAGICAGCRAGINVGDQIRWDTQGKKAYCYPQHKLADQGSSG